MKNTILTEDELEMLRNLTASASSPTETIDISSDEFLALLFKAKKIRLDIHFTQHHLSFPLDDIQSEQLASLPLGVPDIYEVVTTSHRLWRLQKPKYLSLVNEQDLPLPFEIQNISPRGLLLSSNENLLSINQSFHFRLKLEDTMIQMEGTVVRHRLKADKGFEWAIALNLSSDDYIKLQAYIYDAHNDRIQDSDSNFEI